MAPPLRLLERTLQVTSQTPQTPQERWFAATFQKDLVAAVEGLRKPTGEGGVGWELIAGVRVGEGEGGVFEMLVRGAVRVR